MNEWRHLQSSDNYSTTFDNIKKLHVLPHANDKKITRYQVTTNCKDALRSDVNSLCKRVQKHKFTMKKDMKAQKGRKGTDILFL
jgi:hypothetical protein